MARKMICGIVASLMAVTTIHADVVTEWNEVTLVAIRTDLTAPPRASRFLAMVHVAIYDAVNGIYNTHRSYLADPPAPAGASVEAAVVAAAHTVLIAAFPAQMATFDAAREASLSSIANGTAKDTGVEWGENVGAAILAARANDGATLVVAYTPGTEPGEWQPTPPALAPPALPQWGHVIPFGLASGSQFRGEGPPAVNSAEYTAAFNDVKELGAATGSSRTDEQSEIASFWVNGPGTATPPGHWNSIAQEIAQQEGNSLAENARLFALLNIALADAAIVSWDNKYAYSDWRPVTAIRAADSDGNDQTQADPTWSSFIPTPPFPDYTSGHSTFSGAAAVVLAEFFGTDNISFDTSSDAQPDIIRSYDSFSEAANESGRSRIYGGIHWEFSNQDGLSSGRAIGETISDNLLKPLSDSTPRPRLCGTVNLGGLALMMLFTGLRFGSRRR